MDKKQKILDILSTILNEEVNENTNSENVDSWDSIAQLEIIVTIEEEFDIKIPQEKIPELKSTEALCEMVESLC